LGVSAFLLSTGPYQLAAAVELAGTRALSDLERQGLVQAFEFTHELAWKVMQDYCQWQGQSGLAGSRDATRAAFQAGLIRDGEIWMDMIRSRSLTSHTYNQDTVEAIADLILQEYWPLLNGFSQEMQERWKGGQ
jgi:nucleotidyltransferase substrate binding protein (TIGR01987 family)